MQPFDAATFTVSGHRLIEAGAGTGKTYSIVAIYLGLVLEGYPVDQLLVVTFTNAATDELRGRVRGRLHDALAELDGRRERSLELGAFIARHTLDKATARRRLRDAVTELDEVAIYTIHGFCNRALSEFAFRSGMPFDAEFVTEQRELLDEVARDEWRRRIAMLPDLLAAKMVTQWKGPEGLLKALKPYRGMPLRILPELTEDPVDAVIEAMHARDAARDALASCWEEGATEITDHFAAHRSALNGNSYRQGFFDQFAAGVEACLADGRPLNPRYGSTKLAAAVKKGQAFPPPPFSDAAQVLLDAQARLDELLKGFVVHERGRAYHAIGEKAVALRAERRIVTSDDLLTRLANALQGAGGEVLAGRLRERFPVALVDEFQDTDPVQSAIFAAIYADRDARGGLVMIGDPKQAIYAFRGADIYTYLAARQRTGASGQCTLTTNWRSTPALIEAVNRLFTRCPTPFLFDDDMPFLPAVSAPKAVKPLTIDGKPPPPLEFWLAGEVLTNKEEATSGIADRLAGHLCWLLHRGATERATIGDQPLRPRDVAVLVSNHHQAAVVRDALALRGISSATLGRESVYASDEARDLVQLLGAVLDPGDVAAARAALTAGCLGFELEALAAVIDDDARWGVWRGHLQQLHDRWSSHGFIAMFQQLLAGGETGSAAHGAFDMDRRVMGLPGGERRLTNLLQLGELIHAASRREHGMDGLYAWYRRQVASPGEDDEGRLRLESDASLVRILTIHVSKGLQFPVVYLPFLWNCKPVGGNNEHQDVLYHDDNGDAVWNLAPDDAAKARADRDRLAGDLRLLYVALTRAEQQLYVTWGAFGSSGGSAQSALAYLLHDGRSPAELLDGPFDLGGLEPTRIASELTEFAVRDWNDLPSRDRIGDSTSRPAAAARPFSGRVRRDWRVSSYSGLARGSHNPLDRDREERAPEVAPDADSVFAFPRGTRAGNFMHQLLETFDFSRPAIEAAELLDQLLPRHGIAGRWKQTVIDWLGRIVATPLDATGTTLAALEPARRIAELEFFFDAGAIEAESLGTLLEEAAGRVLPALRFEPMRGMLTGQIDLVYEHGGRYFIADYKTNHLGNRAEAYTGSRLDAAIIEHRYDLQYLLYTVALHRHLGRCLSGYDYATHFGGIRYLFLRGMDGTPGQGVFAAHPAAGLIGRLDALLGGGAA